jgi:hypothetical protein
MGVFVDGMIEDRGLQVRVQVQVQIRYRQTNKQTDRQPGKWKTGPAIRESDGDITRAV